MKTFAPTTNWGKTNESSTIEALYSISSRFVVTDSYSSNRKAVKKISLFEKRQNFLREIHLSYSYGVR